MALKLPPEMFSEAISFHSQTGIATQNHLLVRSAHHWLPLPSPTGEEESLCPSLSLLLLFLFLLSFALFFEAEGFLCIPTPPLWFLRPEIGTTDSQ